jgi:very-short-patch-repair endonuclease
MTCIHRTPTKSILVDAFTVHKSANALSKHFGVSRKTVNRWLREHGIAKTKYFKDKSADIEKLLRSGSFLDALEMGCSKKDLTAYFWSRAFQPPTTKLLTRAETKRRCGLLQKHYSQSISEVIHHDPSLEKSIRHWTKNHTLQSDKVTERIYRILHNFKADEVRACVVENIPLKFYTLKKGYGNSDKQVCYLVNDLPEKVSASSQKLFDAICEQLPKELSNEARYATKGREYRVCILQNDTFQHPLRNKKNYYLDFKLKHINIEFDGSTWHNKEKDLVRDEYLKTRNYKILRVDYYEFIKHSEETIKKCLSFINENLNHDRRSKS